MLHLRVATTNSCSATQRKSGTSRRRRSRYAISALLIVDTGMRVGEPRTLEWANVHLEPAAGARFGYLHVPGGKSRYAKRNLSLTGRVSEMLQARQTGTQSRFVFPGESALGTSLDHQHGELRDNASSPRAS